MNGLHRITNGLLEISHRTVNCSTADPLTSQRIHPAESNDFIEIIFFSQETI